MKITKKLLMKIIKEELVRESMIDWQAQDRRERGLPPLNPNYDISNSVPPSPPLPEPKLENPPPLPPATEQDLERGYLSDVITGPYRQNIAFDHRRGEWRRKVFMAPSEGERLTKRQRTLQRMTAVHVDEGSLEDYPMEY